jgi:hypothetical protein
VFDVGCSLHHSTFLIALRRKLGKPKKFVPFIRENFARGQFFHVVPPAVACLSTAIKHKSIKGTKGAYRRFSMEG